MLGELTGSWFDIGREVGSKAGDLVRWVSDVWWDQHMNNYGKGETLQALDLYGDQVAALDAGLIRFVEGVAEGAASELEKSPFANDSSHYQKVLNTNIFDAWTFRHPTASSRQEAEPGEMACSSFVTVGDGPNHSDITIASHNRHCPFNPKCYQIAYVGSPEGGNAYWTITPGGAGAGCQIVNSKGVSVILNAGGDKHLEMGGNAFGVPWFLLFLHVAAHADTAADAIEMLTRGTPEYRANTKRNSLLRTGTWNFLVSDRTECAVVETSCDRYAIRRPGDLGEKGNYLVMTNHCTLDHSYDENNKKTDLPMTAFGDRTSYEGSGKRLDILMKDLDLHYGQIDADLAKSLMKGHHIYGADGNRVDQVWTKEGLVDVTCPHAGPQPHSPQGGSADSKVIVSRPDGVDAHWTLGRPCEWEGDWDWVAF